MPLSPDEQFNLILAVDRIEELAGSGIAFIGYGACEIVRKAPPGQDATFVIFQVNRPSNPGRTLPLPQHRNRIRNELVDLGFNCGGTALWAIGTLVFGAAAASTGGTSGIAAYAANAATMASLAQCSISAYRVYNEATDQAERNDAMDQSFVYQRVAKPGLDVVGLAGASVALRQALRYSGTLTRNGASLGSVLRGDAIARPMRRRITQGLGIQGTRRLSSSTLTARTRLELLETLGAGLDLSGSAIGGLGHEVIVYIQGPDNP